MYACILSLLVLVCTSGMGLAAISVKAFPIFALLTNRCSGKDLRLIF